MTGSRTPGIDLVAKERDTERADARSSASSTRRTPRPEGATSTPSSPPPARTGFTAPDHRLHHRQVGQERRGRAGRPADPGPAARRVGPRRRAPSTGTSSLADAHRRCPREGPKTLRPHQTQGAATRCSTGFAAADRGKLIMACGTGKTFTSLKIAEDLVGVRRHGAVPGARRSRCCPRRCASGSQRGRGRRCVPSRSAPTARSGTQADRGHGRRRPGRARRRPAPTKLLERMGADPASGQMTVVFSTYQSIQAVADGPGSRARRVRPRHLRRGAPHHRRDAGGRGRVRVRPGPRPGVHQGARSGST